MGRRVILIVLAGSGLAAFALLMYLVGWHSGMAVAAAQAQTVRPGAAFTQAPQVPQTLQELIPLPGPNQPEQGPGQSQNCKPIVLFYYQGKLYQLQLGPEGQQGVPSSPPEYFPLTPYQGPQIPGLPFTPPGGSPDSPGFKPVNPRF